jgi:serine/threonine protein kinase
LDLLPDHPRLLKKRGIYYERGDNWFTSPDNEADERYGLPACPERVVFIIEPFARLTLAELLPHLSPAFKVLAFYPILEGVHALHSAGSCPFIHRDLKLVNIGVVSYDDKSIAIVILDYGQTIQFQARSPTRGKAGTPRYQAPEMEHQVHSTPLDIWSYGIIGLRMFVPEWQHSSNVRAGFEKGVARLGADNQTIPRHLVAQMLAWDPNQRISAPDALLHPCFSSVIKESSSPILPDRKRHWQQD